MRQSRQPGRKRVREMLRSRLLRHGTYEIIQLRGCDTPINTRNHLLGDRDGIDMLHVESITQAGNPRCDLVELNALLAPIWVELAQMGKVHGH